MIEHCGFDGQVDFKTEDGRQRPGLMVNVPKQRHIVIDAKTPLDSYQVATEARDEHDRQRHLREC